MLHGGADLVKVIATGAVMTAGGVPGAPEFSEAEIRAAVEEAALYGADVAAHAHGAEGIKRAVRAGVRSVEHGSLMDDEAIELMAAHGTYLVADVYCGDYIAERGAAEGWDAGRPAQERRDHARPARGLRAVRQGRRQDRVRHRQRHLPARLERAAVRVPGAVRARRRWRRSARATATAAELLRMEDDVGTLAPGSLRRPRRGRRRPARRRPAARGRAVRDEGRAGPALA